MKKRILVPITVAALLLTGCQFTKDFEVNLDDKYGVTVDENGNFIGEMLKVQLSDFDVDAALELLFGMPAEEIEPYRESEYSADYEVGDRTFKCSYYVNEEAYGFVYGDFIDGAATCYTAMIPESEYFTEYLSQSMRAFFPEENLDTCTKEEVLALCQPYAEAFGYGEAEVSVYAMTLDCLNQFNEFYNNLMSAPGPGFERITYEVQDEWSAAILAGEKTYEEYAAMIKNGHDALSRGFEWEKKYEAMLLYYRPYWNGKIVDSRRQIMKIIYVPYYNRVIYLNGYLPYEVQESAGEQILISPDEAVNIVLANVGASSQEDIIIDQISLVYSLRFLNLELAKEGNFYTVNPCWRIDYTHEEYGDRFGNDNYTMVIDAIDGIVNSYLY